MREPTGSLSSVQMGKEREEKKKRAIFGQDARHRKGEIEQTNEATLNSLLMKSMPASAHVTDVAV